jgi:hypothetical protein
MSKNLNISENQKKVLIGLLLVGLLTTGVLIGSSLSKDKANEQSIYNTESNRVEENIEAKDIFDPVYFEIGKEMTFATQTIKVNSFRIETTLSSEYSTPWVAAPGTKFVVVDQTVVNTTSNPFVFEEGVLIDSKGSRYDASGDAIGSVDNYLAVRDLAPGIPETGISVYIVPQDSTGFEFGALNARTEKLNLTKLR